MLRTLALAITLLIPLVFSAHTSLSFEIPKLCTFYFLLALLLFLGGLYFQFRPKIKVIPLPKKVYLPLLAFVLCVVLATLLSEDFYTALFGSYFRGQGLFTWLAYFAYFGILLIFFGEKKFQQKFVDGLALLGGAVSVLAGMHWLLPTTLDFWNEGSFFGRLFFPLGHPNFLAQVLLLTIPFSLLRLTRPKLKVFAGISLLLSLTVLFFTQSRGAWLGLWVALGLGFYFCRYRKSLLALWILVPLLFFATVNLVSGFFQNTPLSRLQIGFENIRSVSARQILSGMAGELIRTKPLLGFGADTQRTFTPGVIQPQIFLYERFQDLPDRFHSWPLDLLFQFGFLGFLAFSLFLFVLFWAAFQALRKRPNPALLAALLALTAYSAALLFSFSTTADSVIFWGVLAFLCANLFAGKNFSFPRSLSFGFIALATLFAFWGWQTLRADLHFAEAKSGDAVFATNSIKSATEINPFSSHYREVLIEKLLPVAPPQVILQEIQVAQKIFPHDFRFVLQEAQLQTSLGNFEQADLAFARVAQMAPYSFDVWWRFGQKEIFAGDPEKACRNWGRILEFAPPYWSWGKSLDDKTFSEKERYRIFFQENLDFQTFLTNFREECGLEI